MDAMTHAADVDYLSDLLRVYSRVGREPAFLELIESGAESTLPLHLLSVFIRIVDIGPARINDIAATIDLAKSSVSRQIADLERLGLVEKRPSPTDGRVVVVCATDAGIAAAQASNDRFNLMIAQQTASWPSDTIHDLVARLESLLLGITHTVWPDGRVPSHIRTKLA